MAKIKQEEIKYAVPRNGVLRAPLAASLLARASIEPHQLPRSYAGSRIGLRFIDRGRVLPGWVAGRLAAQLAPTLTHAEFGVVSVPQEILLRL